MENRICGIAVEAKRGSPAFLWKPRDLRSTLESLRSFWVFQYIWQREICFGWVLPWDACGTALQTICVTAAVLREDRGGGYFMVLSRCYHVAVPVHAFIHQLKDIWVISTFW